VLRYVDDVCGIVMQWRQTAHGWILLASTSSNYVMRVTCTASSVIMNKVFTFGFN